MAGEIGKERGKKKEQSRRRRGGHRRRGTRKKSVKVDLLSSLPVEVLAYIVEYISEALELVRLSQVCTKFEESVVRCRRVAFTTRYSSQVLKVLTRRLALWSNLEYVSFCDSNVPAELLSHIIHNNAPTLVCIEISKLPCVRLELIVQILQGLNLFPHLQAFAFCSLNSAHVLQFNLPPGSENALVSLALINTAVMSSSLVSLLTYSSHLHTLCLGGTEVRVDNESFSTSTSEGDESSEEIEQEDRKLVIRTSVRFVEMTHWHSNRDAFLKRLESSSTTGEGIQALDCMNLEDSISLSKDADSNILPCVMRSRDRFRLTTLHKLALQPCSITVQDQVAQLVSLGAQVSARCPKSGTVLYMACQYGNASILRALMSSDRGRAQLWESIFLKTLGHESALFVAALKGHSECVGILCSTLKEELSKQTTREARRKFLKLCDDGNKTRDGWTPLHAASIGGHSECVEQLCESGLFQIDCLDKHHQTPMHVAAHGGHLDVLKILHKFGGRPWLRAKFGEKPTDVASRCNQHECVKFFAGLTRKQPRWNKPQAHVHC